MTKLSAREKGFIQGQAWAIAVMLQYDLDGGQLLRESGLTMADLKQAKVDDYEMERIGPVLNTLIEGGKP